MASGMNVAPSLGAFYEGRMLAAAIMKGNVTVVESCIQASTVNNLYLW